MSNTQVDIVTDFEYLKPNVNLFSGFFTLTNKDKINYTLNVYVIRKNNTTHRYILVNSVVNFNNWASHGCELKPPIPFDYLYEYQPITLKIMGRDRVLVNCDIILDICENEIKSVYEDGGNDAYYEYFHNLQNFYTWMAHIGLYALIDEVTGYQKVRGKNELQQTFKQLYESNKG